MSKKTSKLDRLLDLNSLHTRLIKDVSLQLGEHGISFTEFEIMHYLKNAPGETLTRVDLAVAVGLSTSGLTRLLMPMQKIGLTEKKVNPEGAKLGLIRITKAGKKAFMNACTTVENATNESTKTINNEYINAFFCPNNGLKRN